ncbi:MAG: Ger(x)C family spore germination C-terminal domain-containing protein [Clostridiales bacterium]|nr:Ger(x)C family spore germination C-terminal domain-containing protein [Clostridiales bacterium]
MNLREGRSGGKEAATATTMALLACALFPMEGLYPVTLLAGLLSWLLFEGLAALLSHCTLKPILGLFLVPLLLYAAALPLYATAADQAAVVYPDANAAALLCFFIPCLLVPVLLGLETILRAARLFLWPGVVSLLLILLCAAPQFQTYRLFPILSGGLPELLKQTGRALPRFLAPLLALLSVRRGIHGLAHARRSGRRALALSLPVILSVQFGTALSASRGSLSQMNAPLYQIIEAAQANQQGIRLDRLLIFFWVIVAVLGVAFLLYAAALLICRCFAVRDIRPVGALLVGLAAMLFLTACLPAQPPERYLYVQHIGVERGESLPYRVTLLANQAKPEEGEESTPTQEILSAEAHSLPEAATMLEAELPYQLNFSRASLLVLSSELAKSGEIMELMDISLDKLRLSPYINMAVAEQEIEDLLASPKSFIGFAQLRESRESRALDLLIPLTTDTGSAVFSGANMVGTLSQEDTLPVQIGIGTFQNGRLQIPIENEKVSVTLRRMGAPKVTLEGDSASLFVRLEADAEKPSLKETYTKKELERIIGTHLATEMARVFTVTQAMDADVFGFGKAAIRQCGFMREWDSKAWRATFQRLNVSFAVEIHL